MTWKRSRRSFKAKRPPPSPTQSSLEISKADLNKKSGHGEFKNFVLDNPLFSKYYQSFLCRDAEDWEAFLRVMRTPLPTTFRITEVEGSRGQTTLKTLLNLTAKLHQDNDLSSNIFTLKPLEWYGGQAAWQLSIPRGVLREHSDLARLHVWLVQQTTAGTITRQEAVSMLPPLLLDVKRGMRCLDVCAAPGSKTSQLIEFIHHGQEQTSLLNGSNSETEECPDEAVRRRGYVLANEVDRERAYMLVHHVKRLQSAGLVVCSHDGTQLPSKLNTNLHDSCKLAVANKFDRVLVDVPCSGDGTLRKNPKAWSSWSPAQAIGLHGLQRRLLMRAIQAIDLTEQKNEKDQVCGGRGRVVYSTCSLNPLENEAVVASVLAELKDSPSFSVELIQAPSHLGIKCRPGLLQWPVMVRGGDILQQNNTGGDNLSGLPETLFADKPWNEQIGLDRCLRLLPQDQDTGAFFVAILEVKPKKRCPTNHRQEDSVRDGEVFGTIETSLNDPSPDPARINGHTKKGGPKRSFDELPFKPISKALSSSLCSWYGIDEVGCGLTFISRSPLNNDDSQPRVINVVHASCLPLLGSFRKECGEDGNDCVIWEPSPVQIVNAGVRAFERMVLDDSPHKDGNQLGDGKDLVLYRSIGEGLPSLPVTKRIHRISAETLAKSLAENCSPIPKQSLLKLNSSDPLLSAANNLEDFGEEMGGAVLKVEGLDYAVPAWIRHHAVLIFIPKDDRAFVADALRQLQHQST